MRHPWLLAALLPLVWGAGCQQTRGGGGGHDFDLDHLQVETGQDLLDLCTVDPDYEHAHVVGSFALGYITGVIHFYEAIEDDPQVPQMIDPDAHPTRLEVAEVYVEWAKKNPQHLKEPAVDALWRAVLARWPAPLPEGKGESGGGSR